MTSFSLVILNTLLLYISILFIMIQIKLENDYCYFYIQEGILHEIFKPEVKVMDLNMSKIVVADRLKVSNGVTMPLYVDATPIRFFKPNALKYMAEGDAMKYLSASGLLAKTYIHRLAGNTYYEVFKPSIPTKMHQTYDAAIAWLKLYTLFNN